MSPASVCTYSMRATPRRGRMWDPLRFCMIPPAPPPKFTKVSQVFLLPKLYKCTQITLGSIMLGTKTHPLVFAVCTVTSAKYVRSQMRGTEEHIFVIVLSARRNARITQIESSVSGPMPSGLGARREQMTYLIVEESLNTTQGDPSIPFQLAARID